MVVRSKSTPHPSRIDADWPHQVALPDDLCVDRNFTLINAFLRGSNYHVRNVQAIWPCGKYELWRLHCFADPGKAHAFHDRFAGVMFDPKRDRRKGLVRGPWMREGPYQRILDLGDLHVPAILRN